MEKEILVEHKSLERNKTENHREINFEVARGETQKNVNENILKLLVRKFDKRSTIKILDLPCGSMLFVRYLKKIFPHAQIVGADLQEPQAQASQFVKMDLTKEFILPIEEKYDLITSISGIMMFGNTLSFITNCASRLKPGGTFIVTNDNSATIVDKLFFLFLGKYRIFNQFYRDEETNCTQNVPIQELCRLLRINGLEIETIKYTSFYKRDLIFFPIAILIHPLQQLFLKRFKTKFTSRNINLMYPFQHHFCKHYIVVTNKLF